MQSQKLSDFQRFALSSLVHYDLMMREREGNRVTYGDLGMGAGLGKLISAGQTEGKKISDASLKSKVGTMVGNILSKASPTGALELKRYYKSLVQDENDKSFQNPPPHIKTAIAMLYSKTGDVRQDDALLQEVHQTNEYALSNVFSMIRHKDPKDRELLGKNYEGVWDVIRYSAHQLVTPDRPHEDDPWVIRAALEIGPRDPEQGRMEPWFAIHYRPRGARSFRRSTGSAILINKGHHFSLIGREHDVNAPIYIVAEFVETREDYFQGLVIRRHSKGRLFASRVTFVRSKATKIGDLTDKINVYRETELKERFSADITDLDKCLNDAVNTIANDGKSVLLLG